MELFNITEIQVKPNYYLGYSMKLIILTALLLNYAHSSDLLFEHNAENTSSYSTSRVLEPSVYNNVLPYSPPIVLEPIVYNNALPYSPPIVSEPSARNVESYSPHNTLQPMMWNALQSNVLPSISKLLASPTLQPIVQNAPHLNALPSIADMANFVLRSSNMRFKTSTKAGHSLSISANRPIKKRTHRKTKKPRWYHYQADAEEFTQ